MPELARIEAVVFLQSVDIFSFCKAEEILRVAAIARERPVSAGEGIYRVEDAADSLYCVVRGRVELTSANGTQRTIGPLATFGALDLLTGAERRAEAVAAEDGLLLVIDTEDFFDLLAHNIEIIKALFRHLIPHFTEAH